MSKLSWAFLIISVYLISVVIIGVFFYPGPTEAFCKAEGFDGPDYDGERRACYSKLDDSSIEIFPISCPTAEHLHLNDLLTAFTFRQVKYDCYFVTEGGLK